MQDTDHNDLKCTFEDAERNHLLDGIRMSTRDKIQSFEDMLNFAWRTGVIIHLRNSTQSPDGSHASAQRTQPQKAIK